MDYQKTAQEFIEKYGLTVEPYPRYTDLVSEIGELGKEMLKASNYGAGDIAVANELALEFGDVLFSLACLANNLNIDMQQAFADAVDKYRLRFEKSGQIGS